jgi:hypothetical protein
MARSGIFKGLRRRRRALGALFAYVLLLNALIVAAFNVQAVGAALDPLSAAVTCDSTGSGSGGDPVRHDRQHQPDCTLCSPACPMGGLLLGLGNPVAVVATPPSCFVLHVSAHEKSTVNPPRVYLSDTAAQAPPAIG